jgi:hypothetical protein
MTTGTEIVVESNLMMLSYKKNLLIKCEIDTWTVDKNQNSEALKVVS